MASFMPPPNPRAARARRTTEEDPLSIAGETKYAEVFAHRTMLRFVDIVDVEPDSFRVWSETGLTRTMAGRPKG
jgi:hypothetical protein